MRSRCKNNYCIRPLLLFILFCCCVTCTSSAAVTRLILHLSLQPLRVHGFRRIACVLRLYFMFFSAPKIDGECRFVNSTRDSLTFTWHRATPETSYRLVGDGANGPITIEQNTITVNDLTPGSHYTFAVWAVGSTGLTSNNITCINSTGVLFISVNKLNKFFLRAIRSQLLCNSHV